jgi:predicted nuclease with TOPRIM domain
MVGLSLAPILCCFIGVGAFLHVAVCLLKAQEHERIDLQRELENLAKAAASLQRKLANTEKRIEELQRKRAEERTQAEAAQRIEEELRRLQKQKAELAAKIGQLPGHASTDGGNTQPSASNRELRAELVQKEAAMNAANAENDRLVAQLSALRRLTEDSKKTYEVAQMEGLHDWEAPEPVYVECDGSGVTIQPEKTHFGSSPDAQERQAFLKAAKRTGYVLFLIRPSGFSSFDRYRTLVVSKRGDSGNSIDFGYEPVNGEWNLVYPQAGG